ncbi:MAG: helix-turn-helix domain-containing protein [Actinobacteria bacterium]|nr:helix-turn-helix domain-containing protein [Actinomycetota bacterium]
MEAADQLGISPRRVRTMATDGRIPAHREGAHCNSCPTAAQFRVSFATAD